jgi:RNA 2',3'-cyclic 3'-phosphodiesterase
VRRIALATQRQCLAAAVDFPRMRLFVGIPPSSEVRGELTRVLAPAITKAAEWRWAPPESWHTTLLFLGSTSHEKYELVSTQLRALQSPAIPIQINGVDFFKRAGIFFAGIFPCPELSMLHQKVTEAAAQCGFAPEARAYHPHITLARAKEKLHQKTLSALRERLPARPEFSPIRAQEFLLFESFLSPAGARYEIRERFALR